MRFISSFTKLRRKYDNLHGVMSLAEAAIEGIFLACQCCVGVCEVSTAINRRKLAKEKLIPYCQRYCSISSDACSSFKGLRFKKYNLPLKTRRQLEKMLADESGNSLFSFCQAVAKDKKDVLCIFLHYVIYIFQHGLVSIEEAQELLKKGESYYKSLIQGVKEPEYFPEESTEKGICPVCKYTIESGWEFCANCGYDLKQEPRILKNNNKSNL